MTDRRTRAIAHDDGVNAWRFVRATARPDLDGIAGYTAYREATGGFTTRRELPHCGGVLIVNLGEPISLGLPGGAWIEVETGASVAAGLHMAPVLSRSVGRQAGLHIHLSLPALGRVLRTDMTAMTGRVVKFEALPSPAARHLAERLAQPEGSDAARFELLDRAMDSLLADTPAPHAAIDWAARRLRRKPRISIAALATEIGWSRQHFSHVFAQAFGCSPRAFARIARFERLMEGLRCGSRPGWAELATIHGYADQPHLTRDVASLAGVTPTALAARLLPGGGGILA